MTNNQTLPSKQLILEIGTNKYPINFPNNSAYIDIQAMRHSIAGNPGLYSSMATSNEGAGQYASLTIDMIATFNVLIGNQLKKDMTIKSLLDLGMYETRQLIDVYTDQYLPWYNQWMQIITNPKVDEETTK